MKRHNLKRGVALLIALVMAAALAGCGSGSDGAGASGAATGGSGASSADAGGGAAAGGETLVIGLSMEVDLLDPAFSYDYMTGPVVNCMMESLLIIDEQGQLEPGLASFWEAVDPTTYVYQIRDDVTFSDGNPMTMEDVLYSLERIRDPELASYVSWMFDSVESFEQTGDWELTVKLAQPDALWQYVFSTSAGQIVEKAVVEAAGAEYGALGTTPIGTGPYKLESRIAGGDITLAYNEDYWNSTGTPAFTKIVFQTIPEEATRALAAKTGQIDIDLEMNPELMEDTESGGLATTIVTPRWGADYLAFNCEKEPFSDPNARKAVASAIDIVTFQESIIKDWGSATNHTLVPDSLFVFETETWQQGVKDVPWYDYDLDKAKEYLAASAYPDGFSFVMNVDEYTASNSFALALQQALKELGIEMEINKISNDENISYQLGNGMVGGVRPYDLGFFGWIADFPDPAAMLISIVPSSTDVEGGCNSAQYHNDEVDALIQQQSESTDPVERTKLMLEALNIIGEDVPYYVTDQPNNLFCVSNRIANPEVAVNPAYIWYFPVHKLTLA